MKASSIILFLLTALPAFAQPPIGMVLDIEQRAHTFTYHFEGVTSTNLNEVTKTLTNLIVYAKEQQPESPVFIWVNIKNQTDLTVIEKLKVLLTTHGFTFYTIQSTSEGRMGVLITRENPLQNPIDVDGYFNRKVKIKHKKARKIYTHKNQENQRVDLTVKTPVESDNEQGTAGHP